MIYQIDQLSQGLPRLQITLFNHKITTISFLVTTYLQSAVHVSQRLLLHEITYCVFQPVLYAVVVIPL